MNVFSRIVIGCANWNESRPYGHRGVVCPRAEQEEIISYCMSCGINGIDSAVAYNVDLSWVPTSFWVALKARKGDRLPSYEEMGHEYILDAYGTDSFDYFLAKHREDDRQPLPHGISFYDVAEEPTAEQCIKNHYHFSTRNVPYSPFDRRWETRIEGGYRPSFVRSIFCQGKAFTSDEAPFVRFRKYASELGMPVGTLCILFCLLNPHVDKVIIGVDSAQQLRDNLRFFHRLDSFAVEDLDIIDARRFGETK